MFAAVLVKSPLSPTEKSTVPSSSTVMPPPVWPSLRTCMAVTGLGADKLVPSKW